MSAGLGHLVLVLLLASIVLCLHLESVTLLLGAPLIHVVAISGGTSQTDLNYYCNFAFFTLLDQGYIEVGLFILALLPLPLLFMAQVATID
jgi:hypothetical protein